MPSHRSDEKLKEWTEKKKIRAKRSNPSPSFWRPIGSGSFNQAYRSIILKKLLASSEYQGPWVLKLPMINLDDPSNDELSDVLRAIRLFNEMYPDLAAGAFGEGWVLPYFDGRQATDSEMAEEMRQIWLRTGRTVVDAMAPRNFITVTDKADKSVSTRCIDVDLALARSSSPVSEDYCDNIYEHMSDFWSAYVDSYPKSISTAITLLKIEDDLGIGQEIRDQLSSSMIDALRWFRRQQMDYSSLLIDNLSILVEKGFIRGQPLADSELFNFWYHIARLCTLHDIRINDDQCNILEELQYQPVLGSPYYLPWLGTVVALVECIGEGGARDRLAFRQIGQKVLVGVNPHEAMTEYWQTYPVIPARLTALTEREPPPPAVEASGLVNSLGRLIRGISKTLLPVAPEQNITEATSAEPYEFRL